MKAEDFASATELELRRKANECFEKFENSGSHERPALLIEAQFYIGEIERRKQDKVARRDLLLELVVIILIGLELYFGITGGNQQLATLQKLDASANMTAKALNTLTDQQRAALSAQTEMLGTIQKVNAIMQEELNLLSAERKRQPAVIR
jgi:hypothetical protein